MKDLVPHDQVTIDPTPDATHSTGDISSILITNDLNAEYDNLEDERSDSHSIQPDRDIPIPVYANQHKISETREVPELSKSHIKFTCHNFMAHLPKHISHFTTISTADREVLLSISSYAENDTSLVTIEEELQANFDKLKGIKRSLNKIKLYESQLEGKVWLLIPGSEGLLFQG